MKLTKKVLGLGLAGLMTMSVAACGGGNEEQMVTLLYEQDGVTMEYTMEATGDKVHTITQVSKMDCSLYTEEQVALVEQSLEEYSAVYDEYEGVEYSYTLEDAMISETIKMDVSDSDTIDALSESGLLPIEGEADYISLEKTVDNLEEQGWTVQE